jgi:Mn2+/Fe2+ NRAMP family transporter
MFDLILGIMTSLGGFVDIGELVFTIAGGAKFGFLLLWVVVLGTFGIILYAEMSGRIAAVAHKPTFQIIHDRLGDRLGLGVLIASNVVNLLTCAAEVGGIAIVLQLLFGHDYRLMLIASFGLLLVLLYFLKFRWLERIFGLFGLMLLVYAWVAVAVKPDWGKSKPPKLVPVFTASWMGMIALGCAIAMSGVNPVSIVEYSVIFAVVVLPFTYYPILNAARSKPLLGEHVNSPLITVLGWIYFVLITLAGVSAIPLMIMTHMGDA